MPDMTICLTDDCGLRHHCGRHHKQFKDHELSYRQSMAIFQSYDDNGQTTCEHYFRHHSWDSSGSASDQKGYARYKL
jgi:hypothetical protein